MHVWGQRGIWEILEPSLQFCGECKTALNKQFVKKTKVDLKSEVYS